MEYIELSSSNFLSVDTMNAIYNNFLYLQEQLAEKGYTIEDIRDNSLSHSVGIDEILSKMNYVEANIQNFENNSDWINPYFQEFVWQIRTRERKKHVDRWICYLNFMYAVLAGKEPAAQYLTDSDGNYILDVYGNYITVCKEL